MKITEGMDQIHEVLSNNYPDIVPQFESIQDSLRFCAPEISAIHMERLLELLEENDISPTDPIGVDIQKILTEMR